MFDRVFSKFFKTAAQEQAFPELTQTQNEALVDTLVFAMMADGTMAEQEQRELQTSLDRLTWTSDVTIAAFVEDSIARTRMAKASKKAASDYVEYIATRLEHPLVKEHTYGLASRIVCADEDVSEHERGLMNLFTTAFGLSEERAKDLASEANKAFGLL